MQFRRLCGPASTNPIVCVADFYRNTTIVGLFGISQDIVVKQKKFEYCLDKRLSGDNQPV
jgi:hypothetical protein